MTTQKTNMQKAQSNAQKMQNFRLQSKHPKKCKNGVKKREKNIQAKQTKQ